MAALTPKTAGTAKKLFMTGLYPNGNKVKANKMENVYNTLVDYANRLEQTHPSQARTLKAELHKRAMELSLNDVKDKAAMVHDGTTQTHQNVLKIKEMVAQLASEVNDTANTTKATAALEQQQCFRRLFCAIATNKVSNIKRTIQPEDYSR